MSGKKRRKKVTIDGHTNRKMNDHTYALRRRVIELIYEAKRTIDFPRIDVRITDHVRHEVLGTARLRDCIIWIPAKTVLEGTDMLRHVVFHEIVHAVTGFRHDDNCPLMCAVVYKPCSKSVAHKMLKKYIKESKC